MLVQLEIKRNNQFALIEKWTAEGMATVFAVNSSTCSSVKRREPRERYSNEHRSKFHVGFALHAAAPLFLFLCEKKKNLNRTRPMLMTAAQQVPHDTQDTPERKRSPRGSSHVDRLIVKKKGRNKRLISYHYRTQQRAASGAPNIRTVEFTSFQVF